MDELSYIEYIEILENRDQAANDTFKIWLNSKIGFQCFGSWNRYFLLNYYHTKILMHLKLITEFFRIPALMMKKREKSRICDSLRLLNSYSVHGNESQDS